LPNDKVFVQSSEREIRYCHDNPSMTDSAILSPTFHTISRQCNDVACHEELTTVARGENVRFSSKPNLEISGSEDFWRRKQAAGGWQQTSELLAVEW
jgi:hypothetical protein